MSYSNSGDNKIRRRKISSSNCHRNIVENDLVSSKYTQQNNRSDNIYYEYNK